MIIRRSGEHVISEVFEDEATVIDLAAGTYFALGGSAAVIWAWFDPGVGEEQLRARLETHFVDPDESAVLAFIDELISSGLVVRADTPLDDDPAAMLEPIQRVGFEPPWLERYDDMAALLQLDPVHDVGGAAWPPRGE